MTRCRSFFLGIGQTLVCLAPARLPGGRGLKACPAAL